MIYTVKGFGVVNKTEVDVFLELSEVNVSEVDISSRFFFWNYFIEVDIFSVEEEL